MVFFITARATGFYADLFNRVARQTGLDVLQIHSRMSQSARTKTSEKFRQSEHSILFTSDVTARGMDYPDVTAVVQVGLTEQAQYIHRLGRTARAGKDGHGILLLTPVEKKHMVKELNDMPLVATEIPEFAIGTNSYMDQALADVDGNYELKQSAEQAYRAWLGYYNGCSKKLGWSKEQLVQEANQWARDAGLYEQPGVEKKAVGMMGLRGVPGLHIVPAQPRGNNNQKGQSRAPRNTRPRY
mmetsp:Transcript_7219/g.13011  ORF Transcript_7219/g.13011 Transcript_7219/m.13011 type:complete len:242 (-) Transcript_7219:160-885(-)